MREIRSVAVKARSLRSLKNLSLEEVADRSGLSRRTICRIEAADIVGYNPQLKTVASLARVFGLSAGAFLSNPLNVLRNTVTETT